MQAYSEMKDSGIEWLGRLPGDWSVSRVGSLFKHRNEKVSDKDFEPLSVTKKGIVPQLDDAAKTNDGDNRKKVLTGDFVINSRSDRKGSSGVSPLDGSVSLINTVLSQGKLDSRYTHHLLRSQPFQEEFYHYGQGIVADLWSTNYSRMKAIALPVPPKLIQQKIADFLDTETTRIDDLIAKQERLLELLEEKRRATITHAVTRGLNPSVELKETNIPWMPIVPESWSLIKLGYLVKILSGYSPEQAKPKSSGVHPFYKVDSLNSVDDAGCITSAKDYVSDSKLVEQPIFIVFPKRGGAIFTNKVAIVKNSACFDTNLMGLRPVESKLLPEFIYHWIKVRTLGELADTSTLPQINNKHIAPLPIGLPPIDEQREIVNYINTKNMQADKLMQKIQTQITLLRERRTSLISHAVTGKIKI